MGQSQSLSTEVEIQASPEVVQNVFFDFSRHEQWSKWKIEPFEEGKGLSDVRPNDRIKVNLGTMAFNPLVKENSGDSFSWEGSLYGLFVGKHGFRFSPSTKNEGGTLVTQTEEFRGFLAFLMAPGWSFRQQTLDNWNAFFADLKEEAEKVSSS